MYDEQQAINYVASTDDNRITDSFTNIFKLSFFIMKRGMCAGIVLKTMSAGVEKYDIITHCFGHGFTYTVSNLERLQLKLVSQSDL